MKIIKKLYIILIISIFIIPCNLYAYSDYVIASGKTIGIEIKNKGIIVAGFYKVDNIYIGKEAGLKKGDIITQANNEPIYSIDEFIMKIKNYT